MGVSLDTYWQGIGSFGSFGGIRNQNNKHRGAFGESISLPLDKGCTIQCEEYTLVFNHEPGVL